VNDTKRRFVMHENRKKTKDLMGLVFLLVLGMAFLSGTLQAGVEISFKLSGSYGQLVNGAGDVEEARKGWESYYFDLNQEDGYTTTFDWETPKVTNDFRAELMFRITRNFAISIGSGYLIAKNPGSYTIDRDSIEDYGDIYHSESRGHSAYAQKGTLSAIPITLDAYVFLPIGKKETFTIFAHVGAGYYFGKLDFNLDVDGTSNMTETSGGNLIYQSESTSNLQMTQKTDSNSLGYHGGLGLDIKLTRTLSIGAEAYGRHVVFRNWEGSNVTKLEYRYKSWNIWGGDREGVDSDTDSAYGNLWTYQSGCANENRYTTMWVLDEKPEGTCIHNVRKSSINLNSYGISVSLKLSFNLF
jgi:hypothetical protein